MPQLTIEEPGADTVNRLAAIRGEMEQAAELSRNILRSLTDRDVILAFASDSGAVFEMSNAIAPLVRLGGLMQTQLESMIGLSRTVDQMTDPGTIPSVR